MAEEPASVILQSPAADRREALKQLLADRVRTHGPALYPLSWNQSSLWYLHGLAPESSAYNVGFAARIRSEVDPDALGRAIQGLSDRHAALRTRFRTVHGRPLQEVLPRLETPLVRVDCTDEDDAVLGERVQRDYDRPADLRSGPAMRAVLYERGQRDSALLLMVHHILLDLWSLALVLTELGELYAAEKAGTPPTLEPPVADYSDFVRWQSELLGGEAGEQQFAHWEGALEGAPSVLELPTDRARAPLQTLNGDSLTFELDPELAGALAALARGERTSMYALLLAAFQTLLFRYTEQDDVLVGSPVAGRNDPRFEGVVGHFVNMIVLRGRLQGDPSFRELLAQTRDAVIGAIEHQDYPFPLVVERLDPAREASRPALFQVCFAYQRAPTLDALNGFMVGARDTPPLELGGLELEPFPLSQQQGQFDLSLWMAEANGVLHGELKFNSDLFDEATIARLAGHFETLLRGAAEDPDRRLSELPLVAARERALVIDEWNRTEKPWRREACMHHLFEEQVERTPDALAVTSGESGYTYAELEERANRLAHKLRKLGVGPRSLVAVFVDRSPDTLVAVLGVLKAGGGYVPLETHYPPARLEFIMGSLAIHVAITETSRLGRIQALDVPLLDHLVCVDEPTGQLAADAAGPKQVWTAAALAEQPAERPDGGATADNTAYIIFTSGSTGTPKGVEVRHRPAINLIEWVNETYGVGPGDKLLFITSLSFDLSVYDMFGSLAAGSTIRIAAREEIQDPHRLGAILCEEGITFWDSAPPALHQLVPFLPEHAPDSPLRLVFLSGDWIPVKLPDQVRSIFPKAHVVSLGGATEATIWSNWYDIGEVGSDWVSIPYGKPIQNARYYVLDPSRNPCPIGVPGDLYIGGECLANGYVNDPELSDSKFVPDPYWEPEDARMYLTGDRARFFPDGNIEFLGRRDFQVKVRGYRIELGEIESVLGDHPGIADCTVMARDDGGGELYLAAYVVSPNGDSTGAADLRAHLKERLPDFMVPQYFVPLERLPVTPNGKIDRRALPVPERRREDLATAYVAPATDVERELCEIWQGVLRVDRVGTSDNFFDLGGQSLLAVQVVYEVESRLGAPLPVSTLLQAPTIAELAERIGAPADGAPSVLVPLRDGSGPPLFLLHPSGGEVIAYRALLDDLDPGRALLGVRSPAAAGALERESVGDMARAYAAAIRERQPEGPYLLAGWSLGGVLAHAVAAQLEREGATVALCALIDSALPAERPELLKRASYRLGAAVGPLAGMLADDAPEDVAALLALPEEKRLDEALRLARERGEAFAELSPETIEREIATASAHARLLAEHRPEPVDAPLRVFWAEASLVDGAPPTDWAAHTRAGAEESVLPGAHHYNVLEPPALGRLCTDLTEALEAALPTNVAPD